MPAISTARPRGFGDNFRGSDSTPGDGRTRIARIEHLGRNSRLEAYLTPGLNKLLDCEGTKL